MELVEKLRIKERVAKGVALLDEKEPGWRSKIDVEKFDIDDDCNCVVGQVVGSFYDTAKIWFSDYRAEREKVAAEHGFFATSDVFASLELQEELALLESAWLDVFVGRA